MPYTKRTDINNASEMVSKRELFTKHEVMIKDGIPYTGDSKGNIGTNTMVNFMNWLIQCADYTEQSNKIEILNIKQVSAISHILNPCFMTM